MVICSNMEIQWRWPQPSASTIHCRYQISTNSRELKQFTYNRSYYTVAHSPTIKHTYKLNTCIFFSSIGHKFSMLDLWFCTDFLAWHSRIQFISSRNCTVFLELTNLYHKIQICFYFRNTSCLPMKLHVLYITQIMIDSPSLQPCRCWLSVGTPAHAGGHLLKWLTAQQDNSWCDTFEDPCLHPDCNWGSSFLHSYTTEDPPFCTHYKQKDLKSCECDWSPLTKAVPIKECSFGADPI